MSSRLDPIALAVDKSGDNHNIGWEPTGRSSLDVLRRERPRRPSTRLYFENGPGRRSAAKLLSKDERATQGISL
jgi:hypothetical protein